MSESKIQINARKIRNAIRKEQEAREELMWKKLSTDYTLSENDPMPFRITRTPGKQVWYHPPELRGKTFDKVIIDEWVK